MRAHPATTLIVDHLGLHQPPYLPVTDPPWRDLDRLLALAGTAPCPGQPAPQTDTRPSSLCPQSPIPWTDGTQRHDDRHRSLPEFPDVRARPGDRT